MPPKEVWIIAKFFLLGRAVQDIRRIENQIEPGEECEVRNGEPFPDKELLTLKLSIKDRNDSNNP